MKKSALVLLAASITLVSACQNVKNELGVGRNSPDEFTVVKRAPLSLPPDYTLRAPSAGDVPSASAASSEARTALMGQSSAAANTVAEDSPDSGFLQKTGASAANPDIRSLINKENGIIAIESKSVGDKLIFWKEQSEEQSVPASVVNPAQEAERIKKNKEEGKPVTHGKVPVIEKKQSTIDKLF